jgi:hypothetical protein
MPNSSEYNHKGLILAEFGGGGGETKLIARRIIANSVILVPKLARID